MAFYNPYYNNYNYNPNYNPGYVAQGPQTIQNGGFVTVQSEEEAKSYPVAHGMSVTFRDENAPYIYTKTLGFGQLDSPVFEKFKLLKENGQGAKKTAQKEYSEESPSYVTKAEFEPIRSEIEDLKRTVDMLRRELGDE